jgi:hypothetical protein
MDEGWMRWVFDTFGVKYVTVRNEMLRAGSLADFLDVLVLPGVDARDLDARPRERQRARGFRRRPRSRRRGRGRGVRARRRQPRRDRQLGEVGDRPLNLPVST